MALTGIDSAGLNSLFDIYAPKQYQTQAVAPGTPYSDDVYNTQYTGALPNVMAGAGSAPSKNMAPTYGMGGLATSMARAGANPWENLNQPLTGNFNSPVDPALRSQIQSAGAGMANRGVQAFLGGGFQPYQREYGGTDAGMIAPPDAEAQWQQLRNLAGGLGFNTQGYGNSDQDLNALYNDMNQATKDYWGVSGLEGWTGNKGSGTNSAARTLYKDVGGQLSPVTAPRYYRNVNDNKALISRDAITGLSMVMPAFGGWAGILGQGAGGTLSAGSGLGLTSGVSSAIGTGATNALVNAGAATLSNGGDWRSGLGSLFGAGIGAGMQGNLGSMFQNVGDIGANINPMSYFQQSLRNTGLGGSPLGQSQQLVGGIRNLANLFRS